MSRRSLMRTLLGMFAVVSALHGAPRYAAGAELAASQPWSVNFVPYAWLPWLDGDATVKGRTVSVKVDPIQVLEHLERAPFMGYLEAGKGPIFLYGDVVYANLGLNADGIRFRQVAPGIGATLTAALGLDFEQTIMEVGGGYEVMKVNQIAFDVLAGARYWRQDLGVNLALGLDITGLNISRGIAIARSGDVDWLDPLVGGRIRMNVARGEVLLLRADVGGFGVGSEISWNALAAYSFDIAAMDGVTYSGILGYRALYVDYEQGSGRTKYEYDVLQHGPVTGLSVRF